MKRLNWLCILIILLWVSTQLNQNVHAQQYTVNMVTYMTKAGDSLSQFTLIGKDLQPALKRMETKLGKPGMNTSRKKIWEEIGITGIEQACTLTMTGGKFIHKGKHAIQKPGNLPGATESKPLKKEEYWFVQFIVSDESHSNLSDAANRELVKTWLGKLVNE